MAFTVGFWNVQRFGTGSDENSAKGPQISAWVNTFRPDLMLFAEIYSSFAAGNFNAGTQRRGVSYHNISYVNTLDYNGDPTGLCLGAWYRQPGPSYATPFSNIAARSVRLDDLTRASLKLTFKANGKTFDGIYVLHANASKKGGENAIGTICDTLDTAKLACAIGDYNYDLGKDSLGVVANKMLGVYKGVDADNKPFQLTQKSGGILDFLVTGGNWEGGNITAEPSVDGDGCSVARLFGGASDHLPILYTIS